METLGLLEISEGELQTNASGGLSDDAVTGQFWISNVGSGRANLEESHCTLWISLSLPMERPDLPYGRDLRDRPPLEPGTATTIAFSYPPLTRPKGEALEKRQTNVYFVGTITYRDDIGTRRTTYFCRLFDYAKGRFFPVNDPDYEYAD